MKKLIFGVILILAGACILMGETGSNKAGKTRLFILSGQSNMVHFDPAPTFEPALQKAFPGDQIIVVKDAHVGQPIRKWYKNFKVPEGWVPPVKGPTDGSPADLKGPTGGLYDVMMEKVKAATANKKIDSITFVWMQGARDVFSGLSSIYEVNLQGLIKQLRDDMHRQDITMVVGRLSTAHKGEKDWDEVRAAQVSACTKDPLAGWVDTDGLNGAAGTNMHYTHKGLLELGDRFAAKAIELINRQEKAH
jgi:Carbohydrate esterase, sialic acid-specific acetylesterase